MADFALWGMAVSEAMGYGANSFLELYDRNIKQQNEEIINSNPVGIALMDFMDDRLMWSGSVSGLLSELNDRREALKIDKRMKSWPKAPHALGRKIRELETTLNAVGIRTYADRTSKVRRITIEKSDAFTSKNDGTTEKKRHSLTD